MIRLFADRTENAESRLEEILTNLTGEKPVILRTENGKPYIEGNPVFFSVTHSGTRLFIATYEKPVGIDLELYKSARHPFTLSRFRKEEQDEICGERDFLVHWTAREAFVKMHGLTLAETFKSMAYYGGNFYLNDEKQSVEIINYFFNYGVCSICVPRD